MSKPKIVLTGGPGAGKTAVLETLRRVVCPHVAVLPEAAGILFSGGFWRLPSVEGRKASQRAIFHVQRQLETMAENEAKFTSVLCDRGSLDGLAYWPTSSEDFFLDLGVNLKKELERYTTVIHLRTPPVTGYNHQNPVRTESPEMAREIDEKIVLAWSGHPNRIFVENSANFLDKAQSALALILQELPECCEILHHHQKQWK